MRYLLLFAFVLPCQAQYLEFDVDHYEEKGYSSYMLIHTISKPDSVYMAINSIALELMCRPDTSAVFTLLYPVGMDSLHLVATSPDTALTTRLVKDDVGYSAIVKESHLEEMNDWRMIYTVGPDTLSAYAIREALDEYITQVRALPLCP